MAITPICGIYKITNPSGRIYIGQSCGIKGRFRQYERLTNCKDQILLYNSLRKHGYANHKFEIVEHCLESELDEKEIYYIELYQCFNSKHGMNLKTGGANGKASDETKNRMSESQKKRYALFGSPMKGRKSSEETKKRISIAGRGRITSEETKEKMRISAKGKNLGKKHTEETKRMYSITRTGENNPCFGTGGKTHPMFGGKSPCSKKVTQMDLDGNVIKIWDSLSDACRNLGKSTGRVSKICRREVKTDIVYGFRWKFTNNK